MAIGNVFAQDAAANAAMAGFAKMGAAKGALAATATAVGAGVATAATLAVPVAVFGGIVYLLTKDDGKKVGAAK